LQLDFSAMGIDVAAVTPIMVLGVLGMAVLVLGLFVGKDQGGLLAGFCLGGLAVAAATIVPLLGSHRSAFAGMMAVDNFYLFFATISIAVDSINNAKVIDEPERIKSFTRIIKEENNRMNARVEQVLQMALLDSSEFRLNLKSVDLNALVTKVAGNIRLQVENREGRLELQPDALNSLVEADEIHLSNVIMNLLDNANKYSPGKPEIRVTTTNRGSSVMVTVEDKGMGMNTETQRKIFEKFYRLTNGNIHNVKGFGLGLSYARAIVLAHKGEIKVTSEAGKGSTFVVTLPVIADELMS